MDENWRCEIWGTPSVGNGNTERSGTLVDSPRAGGKYFVTRRGKITLQGLDDRLKPRLTTWLVEQRRLGNDCPDIDFGTAGEAEARRDLRVAERADGVLRCLETKVAHVGAKVTYQVFRPMYEEMNPELAETFYLELLAWSESVVPDELRFLMDYLQQCGYVQSEGDPRKGAQCVLTVSGYERLAALGASHAQSTQGFVAMWFDHSTQDAWEEGIRPGIVAAGYEPFRVDQKEHSNKIDDEIVAEIRKSRFVVADFTQGAKGARGGVYYEAGFAHGLDIPVIFTCHADVLGEVHLDTRQYNHIKWETAQELCKKLTKRIGAVVGEGPLRPGNG